MYLVYNSDILSQEDLQLATSNRAFQYGDGLFETIRYEAGKLWFWPDHFERLTQGMAALSLTIPAFESLRLHDQVIHLLQTNNLASQPARIKIQVWRQPGGLYTPTTDQADYLITVQSGNPFAITSRPRLGFFESVRLSPSPISAFKTLNALPYVLAGIHRQELELDDVVLLSAEGYLAECIASNLFWLQRDRLHTPSLQTGCINGIARRQLLRTFPDTEEGFFLPSILDQADVVFAANVMGIQVFRGTLNSTLMTQMQQIFTD